MPQRVLGVNRDEHNTTVAVPELIKTVLESENFRRADEAESCRNEEEDEPWKIWVGCTRLDGWMNVGA
jgi:hypothetical protein|tara:strand:+ start:10811 stop:11014 length:204 start_codon:yes stop_codon:yes gene_type:complete